MFILKILDDHETDWPNSLIEKWIVWFFLNYEFSSIKQAIEGGQHVKY